MTVDRTTASRMGEEYKSEIQHSIRILSDPPNSPVTIKLKKSSNPLIHSGFMRQKVTYRIG